MTDHTTTMAPGASAPGPSPVPDQVRARYLAALRTPPLPCGRHRDPELHGTGTAGPSSFSLTAAELLAQASSLRAAGWTPDEIAERLDFRQAMPA